MNKELKMIWKKKQKRDRLNLKKRKMNKKKET